MSGSLDSHPFVPLARRLLAAAQDANVATELLVGVDRHGVVDVRLVPAVRSLTGWSAPADWHAIILIATGHCVGSADQHRRLAIVAADELPIVVVMEHQLLTCAPCPLTDLLQRAVGATTPPAALTVSALAGRVWLDRLIDLLADHPGSSSAAWEELAKRHPIAPAAGRRRPADARALSRLARSLDEPGGWRRLAQSLRDTDLSVPPDLEAWFDAGSFERWLLHRLPEPHDLLDDLAALLGPACLADVRHVVGEP